MESGEALAEDISHEEATPYPASFWFMLLLTLLVITALWYKKYLMKPVWCPSSARLDGKTVLLTGGSSGIGAATARELAGRGASLILASRDVAKATRISKEISSEIDSTSIIVRHLDLSSFQSIREFAADIILNEEKVDILINNAGICCPSYELTGDYVERTFAVNYLGPFLLTRLLLPVLEANAPSRVINVSAHTHVFGRIRMDDLQMTQSYSGFTAYCQSKLALIMFTRSLAEYGSDHGITTYAVHPGVTLTPLRHNDSTLKKLLLQWFCRQPVEGAQTTLFCAVEEKLVKETGWYYSNCARSVPMKLAFDEEIGQQLWEASEDLLSLSPLTDQQSYALEELD